MERIEKEREREREREREEEEEEEEEERPNRGSKRKGKDLKRSERAHTRNVFMRKTHTIIIIVTNLC